MDISKLIALSKERDLQFHFHIFNGKFFFEISTPNDIDISWHSKRPTSTEVEFNKRLALCKNAKH